MASSPPSDTAIKTRIISHMNADHSSSLSRYLEAFCDVPHLSARHAILHDISLSSLTIRSYPPFFSSTPIAHTIPLSPPLSSFADARTRLVELDALATKKLNRSSITISRFVYPSPVEAAVIVGVIAGLVAFTDGRNFAEGSLYRRTVFRFLPGLARAFERWHWEVWGTILGIHVFESGIMTGRLKRWNVRPFCGVWWAWVLCCFLEGFGSLKRVRQEGERLEEEKRLKEKKDGGH